MDGKNFGISWQIRVAKTVIAGLSIQYNTKISFYQNQLEREMLPEFFEGEISTLILKEGYI